MRIFINAMLGFALLGLMAGLAPVAEQQLAARLRHIKSDHAVAEAAQHIALRPSILQ